MPIQKQLVPVQLGGLNTKPDPKQLQAPNLLTLSNGQFNKVGQINKRFGYSVLNTNIQGGGNISAGVELASYLDQLILMDGNNIYAYLAATGNWINRGTAISITTNDTNIIRTSAAQQLNPDMAYLNGIEVYAWEDSRGGVYYTVTDTATGSQVIAGQQLAANGQQPKVVAFQSYIFIFWNNGNTNLYYQLINPFNPSIVQAPVLIASDGLNNLTGFPYDVSVVSQQLFVGYLSSSTPTGAIQLFFLSANLIKSNTVIATNVPTQAINSGYHGAISVVGDSGNNCWITWSTGIDVRTSLFTYTLNQTLSNVQVTTGQINTLTSCESPTPLTLLVIYEVYNATPYNTQTRLRTVNPSGIRGIGPVIRSVGLASKPFIYNNNLYINCAYQSTLQATDFTFLLAQQGTLLATPTIVAKETPSVGGGLQTNGMCPNIYQITPGIFKFANLTASSLISEANTLFTLLGVNSTTLRFTPSDGFINAVQSNTLLIVGGILQGYDGVSTTEVGFHIYPENITAATAGSGSGLGTGTYQYMVEFQWTDNHGQIYRSAPSVPISVQVNAGQNVNLGGPMLRLTAKTTPISIVISRTAANGTVFNEVTSVLQPTLNDTNSDTWSFTDSLSDLAASSNQLEYTTGGILSNIAPPANAIIATYNNRVFLSGMSDPLLMWYSQTTVNNANSNTVPPQFCAELTMAVDPRGGAITGLGVINQVLIIFKESQIFSVQGYGPDSTGNNSDYGDPVFITSDAGCINGNSIVVMPSGLMFQSAKGIYLIDQSGNLEYIGAQVEAYNSYNITSSVLDANSNQVIFTTSQGISLVYDYYTKQWSTWSNQFALDSEIYNNNFVFVTANGQVWTQNQAVFTDNSSPVYMSFTTPNLSFAGIQGYQRVFRCYILGTYKGPHTLNISVAYDYNDTYTQFATVNPNANISTWGSGSAWGTPIGGPWGGTYQLYEYRIDFAVQRCTAIRLMITDNQSSNYNEGYAISSIVFEVGALPGGNRLPAAQTYGAK